MKKLLVAMCFTCALVLAVQAGDGRHDKKKHEQTAEQKALRKDMLAKYDANKDGKLDKVEKAKMTTEEKAKWEKAFPARKKKNSEKN